MIQIACYILLHLGEDLLLPRYCHNFIFAPKLVLITYDLLVRFTYILPCLQKGFNFQVRFMLQIPLREKCPYTELFWLYFPAFGLNRERYSVPLRIQYECGKIRTRITLNTDTFYSVSFVI